MSHYSVLVIGEDVEKQLQPYHEYECTGIEDEYVVEVNKNDEVKEFLMYSAFFCFSSFVILLNMTNIRKVIVIYKKRGFKTPFFICTYS
jgi:hypothetical protein